VEPNRLESIKTVSNVLFLRRVRLEHAVQELFRQKKSLAEVALAAGFCDQSHLTRALKSQLGMTPAKLTSAMHARSSDI
jgi:AraC family transcriptional regulator